MIRQHSLAKRLAHFRHEDFGGSSALALSLIMGAFILGGLSLDLAYAYKTRNELQIAADAAAHAALYMRQSETATDAKAKAVEVAKGTLPPNSYGNVLEAGDITFGLWDFTTQTFAADPNGTEAVLVSTKRFKSKSNELRTFMLNFVGMDSFDVQSGSVFVTHYPTCLNQGFAAHDSVDMQSNNIFYSGFCVHSNNLVSMKQNNDFEPGVIVSMPDTRSVSAGGGNDGLKEALESHAYKLRILDHMDDIWAELQTGGASVPSYITNTAVIPVTADKIIGTNTTSLIVSFGEADLLQGRIYLVDCDTASAITIDNNVLIENVVILTTCNLDFKNGSAVENSLLMTQSTSAASVSATSGFTLGRNDNCAAGGGAQVLTYGGFRVPAKFLIFGGQVIAKGDIQFAAQAGAQGASFVAGGKIDGTSNSTFLFCQTGMEQNLQKPYFRLAG